MQKQIHHGRTTEPKRPRSQAPPTEPETVLALVAIDVGTAVTTADDGNERDAVTLRLTAVSPATGQDIALPALVIPAGVGVDWNVLADSIRRRGKEVEAAHERRIGGGDEPNRKPPTTWRVCGVRIFEERAEAGICGECDG